MNKKIILVVALVVLLLASFYLLYISMGDSTVVPADNNVLNEISSEQNSNLDENLNLDDNENLNTDTSEDEDGNLEEENNDIVLGITVDQDEIIADENALLVSGIANTYEATVNFKLYDANGTLVVEDFTTANMPDMGIAGPFKKVIAFAMPTPDVTSGYLEVFEYSVRDGSQVNKVTVPVSFPYNDFMTLDVYFSHSAPAGSPGECSYVQPIERVMPASPAVAKNVLWAMLKGPNALEHSEGFFTNIPSGTTLNSISIENGVAYADFSSELNMTSGSCGIAGVISMIRKNLLQFPTVDDVVISIEGETENILQP